MSIFKSFTVYQNQIGVLYRDGQFVRLLTPGKHRFWGGGYLCEIVDMRERHEAVFGQEILTADQLIVKISVIVEVKVVDTQRFSSHSYHESGQFYQSQHFQSSKIHLETQLALRQIVAQLKFDDCLSNPQSICDQLKPAILDCVQDLGMEVIGVSVRDVMIPNQMKKAALAVVIAQKEGLAALERARGESAALRSLLNAANLVKEHPELLQLRTIQALESGKSASALIDMTKKG
jgi:regulator of protease activity HflC (stomatin/prohibitin superfamily)